MTITISKINSNSQEVVFACDNLCFQSNTYITEFKKAYNGITCFFTEQEIERLETDLIELNGSDVIMSIKQLNIKIIYNDFKSIISNKKIYLFGEDSQWI